MINFTNILKNQLLNITLANLSMIYLFHLPHPRVVTAKLLSSGIVSQKNVKEIEKIHCFKTKVKEHLLASL